MPAFASIAPPSLPLARPSTPVGVYRYQPSGAPRYAHLPNVRVLSIACREGPDPGTARFRYVFNPADPTTDPTSFEQALAVDTDLANVVRNDDRLVVLTVNPDGSMEPLFDGFAQVPELNLSASQELVTFLAYGAAVREWDTPVGGAVMRDADDPEEAEDVETDLDTNFNPGGQPNATPEGADAADDSGYTYPTFLDPLVVRSPDLRRLWSLPMAVRYLCYRHNPDQTYVQNPDGDLIDSLLDSRTPATGVTLDPSDPDSYRSDPILVPDYFATGKPWPVALHELLEPNGFGMVFRLETNADGDPTTRLDLFRRQDGSADSYKDLYLQPSGDALDPGLTNLTGARVARDTAGVANVFTVGSSPVRYEATFVLAPGFVISPADAANSLAVRGFDRGDPSYSKTNRDKYRLYVFDETGEGHWDFKTSAFVETAASLASVLGGDDDEPLPYVRRRRPPVGVLFTQDPALRPLRARLAISTNYAGPRPGVWDGTGVWQNVVGGFDVLSDRLGVWLNVPNPNGWNIGVPTVGGMPYPAGVVKGVEDQANGGAPNFSLRLTCVVEGDSRVKATAGRRPSSSTSFTVTRWVDAGDRYAKRVVAAESEFNPTTSPVVVQDDTEDAAAEAAARRLAAEAGEVAGSAMIPRFTAAYRVGDKIRSILGRNLSLRTNAGAPSVEGQVFPCVVGVTWNFDAKQHTTLQLSDHRAELR